MCSKKIFIGLFVILLTFHLSSSQLISIPAPSILLLSLLSPKSIQYVEAVSTSSENNKRRRQEREKRRQQREEQRRQFKQQYFGDDYSTNSEEGGTTSSFDMSSLPSLFNTQKPRDILEGFKMSLSNTLRGTFYGLTAFIATPIGGLKYGIIGFIGGILTGSILGITMPLYGVIVGITQFARGIIETPQAIMDGFVNCKVYDDTKREWLEYRLDDDIDEINKLMKDEQQIKGSSSGSSRGSTTSSSSRRRVKSTEYYDLLDIQPDASPSEIRSAYRKKARIIHPDKNPEDPNAEETFRILSAAYQTLSDPNKRHKYDTSGRGVDPESPDGMNDNGVMIDPIVFFAILFGSEQVEPYIGELSLATTFDALLKLGNSGGGRTSSSFESWEDIKTAFGWNEAALKRRKRETEIAIHLRSRISDYVDGYLTLDAFKDGCWEEAIQIAKGGSSSYGASFLLAIGPALIVEADAFLGYRSSVLGSWRGPISNIKRNMLFIRRKFAVGRSILRTISHSLRALYESAEVTPSNNVNKHQQQRRHDRSRSSSDKNKKRSDNDRVEFDQELLKDNLSNTIPTILDMAWAINYVDISNTLYGACGKLFYDADVSSWEERLRRAEAVHILGSQFYIVGLEVSGGNRTVMTSDNVDDIKAQANAAFMESLKKKSRDNDEM